MVTLPQFEGSWSAYCAKSNCMVSAGCLSLSACKLPVQIPIYLYSCSYHSSLAAVWLISILPVTKLYAKVTLGHPFPLNYQITVK